jgi:nucleoside-diphosphate-sugar epimerase
MRILVTGGAGMIGSNLVKTLISQNHDVTVVDNYWRGKLNYLKNDDVLVTNKIINADLRDYSKTLEVIKGFDFVFHLADIVAGINYVFDNQLFLWRSNIMINSNVINACIENNIKNLVYVGTACSYPKEKQSYIGPPLFKEEDAYPAEPESSYGWSKLMGEYEAELALETGKINVGILRMHNVYGPPCELDPDKSQVIPALCRKAILYPKEPFIVWGSGNQRRSFVYIDDIIDALVDVRACGMNKGVIQIGTDHSDSIADIAKKIMGISGKDINIQFDLDKPEGDVDRAADCSKAKQILDWSPKVSIDKGLEKTYEWCLRELG